MHFVCCTNLATDSCMHHASAQTLLHSWDTPLINANLQPPITSTCTRLAHQCPAPCQPGFDQCSCTYAAMAAVPCSSNLRVIMHSPHHKYGALVPCCSRCYHDDTFGYKREGARRQKEGGTLGYVWRIKGKREEKVKGR